MCVAIPIRIKSFKKHSAILEDGRKVNLSLVNNVKKGDWLLCHADLAINKLDKNEAQEILKLNKMCAHQGV